MKVSDYISEFLYAQKIQYIFEVVGGMITHLIDSVHKNRDIQLISCHHEQAAAFAAEAYARISKNPGVAMATSGPGAVNLLTGIGSCYFDSIPALFITGQVNINEQKGSRNIRQLGFQETDIVSMAKPITKRAWQVDSPEDIPTILTDAFKLSLSGRPGPVLIDIPMDVQRSQINTEAPSKLKFEIDNYVDQEEIEKILSELNNAKRPLVLVGGGIHSANANELFRKFIHKIKIPVLNSLMAVDSLPYSDTYRVGMIGSYGNRWANLALGRSDFLLVLGSRLDIRQTGSDVDSFKSERIIYHVDCDSGEINNRISGCNSIVHHLKPFLLKALETKVINKISDKSEWVNEILELKQQWPDTLELNGISGINPNKFMHILSSSSKTAGAYVVDVGQNQMWAGQSLELNSNQRFISSGGMGAMGYALPAAVGASLAYSGQPIVVISGDGGFQINIQELQTVKSNNLPIKIVILNNNCYGMVRQFQESYFNECYQSTLWGYSAPDFTKVANAYGIDSCTVNELSEIQDGIAKMWNDSNSPFLLQVMIDNYTNVYPKIAFGKPITEMEPFSKPIDIEGI